MHFRIAEGRRELHRARLDHARRLARKYVGERWRAAGAVLAIVLGPHKEAQVALERAGLRQRGFKGRVFRAPVVHAVAQPQHRPALSAAKGNTYARPPIAAQAGEFFSLRNLTVRERSNGRRQLFKLPAQTA